jgi:hypothetical protein
MRLSIKRFLAFIIDIFIILAIICIVESLFAIILHFFQGLIIFAGRPLLLGWELIIIPFLFLLRDFKCKRFLSVGNSIFGLNILSIENDSSERASVFKIILRSVIFFYAPLILFSLFFVVVGIDMFELLMWKKYAYLKVMLICGFWVFIYCVFPMSVLLNKGKLGIHDWLSKTFVVGRDFDGFKPVFSKKLMLASLIGSLTISVFMLFMMTLVLEHSGENIKDRMIALGQQMGFFPQHDTKFVDVLNFDEPVESFSKYRMPLKRYYIKGKLLEGDTLKVSDIRDLIFEYSIYPEKLGDSVSLLNNEVIPKGTAYIGMSFWVARPCDDIITMKYLLLEGVAQRTFRIFPEIKWILIKINRGVRFNMISVGSCESYWFKLDSKGSLSTPISQINYSLADLIRWTMSSRIYFSNNWPFIVVSSVGSVFE